jgi:hypothetical protein
MISGWGCSIFWVGATQYTNLCANDTNKGLYNSMFFVGNKMSMVTGNLIAAFVLSQNTSEDSKSEAKLYIGFSVLCFTMAFYFLIFIRKPLPQIRLMDSIIEKQ